MQTKLARTLITLLALAEFTRAQDTPFKDPGRLSGSGLPAGGIYGNWKLSLRLLFLSLLLFSTTGVRAQNANLVMTFTNPPPATGDAFGIAMAGVGTDKVVIGAIFDDTGATDTGAAFLFSTNGTLLIVFTNPAPANFDYFAYAVTGVGADRVVIGAVGGDVGGQDAGTAYLFDFNGTLLTTFTNPTLAGGDFFGIAVAGVGGDKVVIGASFDGTSAPTAGAAYLFSTNGTLLNTFTNPTPAEGDLFGGSVVGVGPDLVLIGANSDDAGETNAGAAYLFDLNGNLLTTFTNPAPTFRGEFGGAVAAVGSDRVLIGADRDGAAALNGGVAYLFSTNGTLLTTFTNPTPAAFDRFGITLAAVGGDRVLIGAFSDNTGTADAGAAYLFELNGTLLTTITNPTPASSDQFGYAVAALGSDHFVIGAYEDDPGETDAGAVYLYALPPVAAPRLTISLTPTNTIVISWPSPATGFTLQTNETLNPTNWGDVPAISDNGTTKSIVVNAPTGNRFYRLFKP